MKVFKVLYYLSKLLNKLSKSLNTDLRIPVSVFCLRIDDHGRCKTSHGLWNTHHIVADPPSTIERINFECLTIGQVVVLVAVRIVVERKRPYLPVVVLRPGHSSTVDWTMSPTRMVCWYLFFGVKTEFCITTCIISI